MQPDDEELMAIATLALAGMGAWCPPTPPDFDHSDAAKVAEVKAKWAFAQADAMLAERQRRRDEEAERLRTPR